MNRFQFVPLELSSVDYVIISSQFPYYGSEYVTSGELVIDEIRQNPLILKGSFKGLVAYRVSSLSSYPRDTVEVTGGVMNVEF